MKWLFYLLLLANIGCFAYFQLVSGGNGEVQSAHAAFNADKIRLLNSRELTPAQAFTTAAKIETVSTPTTAKSLACLEWGSFFGEDLVHEQQALDKLQLGEKLTSRSVEEGATYWVYIPPLKTRKDAEKKITELKARNVAEYFLVVDGPSKNAISLGIFKSEALAKSHLVALQAQGVRSAVINERTQAATHTLFQIRDADEQVAARIGEVQRDFPGSEIKTIDCPKPETAATAR
jgi:hypothetical protein